MKNIFIVLIISFLFVSCVNNQKEISDNSFKMPELSYSGLTAEQISTIDDYLKEFEQKLRNSEEKFSEETIQKALYIKKREEIQKFLIK